MKTLHHYLLLVCCIISIAADAFKYGASLQGKVTDAIDGSPLIGVSIYFPELHVGTVTNEKGEYFIMDLPSIATTVQVSYIGHQTISQIVNLKATRTLDFRMKESNAMLNEVIVTGITGSLLKKDSPTPITIISNHDLRMIASTNIIDALSKQPGISQITTGSGISKPIIRGLGFNRIVVINDGIRQEGQQWGDEHGIEIDSETISSIEILKGPASLMYGSDALAGVIIFHEYPMPSKGEIHANAFTEYQTNNGLYKFSVDMNGNKNGFVWNWRYSDKMAHAYKNKYEGYVLNSQFKERAISGITGWNKHWGYSHLILNHYHLIPSIIEGERDEETGKFIMPVVIDGKENEAIATRHDLKTYKYGMPYQEVNHYKAVLDNSFFIGKGNLKFLLGYQQNRRKEFEEVLTPHECGLDFLLQTLNYDLHYYNTTSKGWKVAAGLNGMYQESTNKGTEFLIPAYHLLDYGIFSTIGKRFSQWNINAGIRYDNRHVHGKELYEDDALRFSSFTRNFHGFTGSIGAIYNVTKELDLKLNISKGYRAPNISELASNGVHEGTFRYEYGNIHLKPEYSWQFDIGCDYSSAVFSSQLALFFNRIDHYIFAKRLADEQYNPIITEGKPTYEYTEGDARLIGGELNVDIHPIEELHIANTFSYVNSVQLHQPSESKYLPYTPAPKWMSEIKYDIIRDGKLLNNTYLSFGLECYLRQNHYYKVNRTETATPSYTLLNASAGTDINIHGKKALSIYITAHNITNRAYQNHLSRLKYMDINQKTGREGVFNMGRNFCVTCVVPIF